jgi:transcriptional regulator EpsA
MDDLSQLPADVQEHLLRAIESSQVVRSRGQLFMWAQGQLQALAPHGLMTCVVFNDQREVMQTQCLQGVVLDEAVLTRLNDPADGFTVRVARHCREFGLRSFDFFADHASVAPQWQGLVQEWDDLNMGHAMFLDTGPLAGGLSSFFGVLGLKHKPDLMQHMLMRALLPQLHVALLRVQHYTTLDIPDTAAVAEPVEAPTLTDRQLEILHWVRQGKTNFEIALILDISVLTVKNHLQKLFKRLNVHNRVQAVARIMEMDESGK